MPDVSKLKRVDLREVWPNEASDFTPWLADNLEELGEALGMDIELVQTEASIGSFSLDIEARDNENRTVVIENQLEPTNHDHLGKVLTYAAGLNADVMVWIVREFRDEHRQALDWLNQRTSEETEFYGVEVRAVRIEDSPAAPIFELVARPNSFRKRRIASAARELSSPKRDAYYAFWPRVIDPLRDKHRLTSRTSSTKTSWVPIGTRIPGVGGGTNFTKKDARVDLFIDTEEKSRNKRIFDALHEQKERVETAFGEGLSWERLDTARGFRIALYLPDRSVNDPEEILGDTAEWMVNRFVKLSNTVAPIVREVMDTIEDDDEVSEDQITEMQEP